MWCVVWEDFYVIMSFLGSIGHIMAGSGLVEALQCCYGSVSINHMLTGKAVARAFRAHSLVQSSLFSLLIECSINLSLEETSSPSLQSEDIEEPKTVYNDFLTSSMTTNDAILPSCLQKLHIVLLANRVKLRNECQTSRLYLEYIDYVSL